MAIDFTYERWEKVKVDARLWWAGELGRPLLHTTVSGADAGRDEPRAFPEGVNPLYELSIPAEDVVDHWDWGLSRQEYMGDAFPSVWPNFGPGVLAAFMGARHEVADWTVWFHPAEPQELADLHFSYDPDNVWVRRIKDVCRAAMERWEGMVLVGMTDLGGTLDVLSTFRPADELLLDLYDHPDEVKRATWEIHQAWWQAYDDITSALQPVNPGHASWACIYSQKTSFMLQCDFAYMIGPEMFDEFVKPEFAATCERMGNAFYHLDGVGQLPHLASMLKIDALKGIQWVPGTGHDHEDWSAVYQQVHAGGKLMQIYDDDKLELMDWMAGQIASVDCIVQIARMGQDSRHVGLEQLKKYGAI